MRTRLRITVLAAVAALAGLLGIGSGEARAQIVVNTPGLSLGVGTPGYGVYPGYPYGAYPGCGCSSIVMIMAGILLVLAGMMRGCNM